MKKKTMALLVACALILTCAIGGTLAWLMDTTEDVTNTFKPSTIDITLTEEAGKETGNNFKMIPGHIITKDPVVTVEEGSEPCWVFVKVEESTNFDNFMTYTMAEGWVALDDTYPGIYYYKDPIKNAEDSDVLAGDKVLNILKDNQVEVVDAVSKAEMDALAAGGTNPTLKFTAAAIQYYESNGKDFTAKVAVTKLPKEFTGVEQEP